MNSIQVQSIISEALSAPAVARATATERLHEHTLLQKLTADAVSARTAATATFAAESGVECKDAAPFNGGWSFFAFVGNDDAKGAAVIAAINRLGFVAKRHEVNDRHNRGATFYANLG